MLRAIRNSLRFMTLAERITYFSLVSLKALSGLLDIAGIALIGLLSGIAASSVLSSKPLRIFGVTLPTAKDETLLFLVVFILVVFILKAALAIYLGKAVAGFIAKVETEKSVEIARLIFSGTLSEVQQMSKGEIHYAVTGSTYSAYSGLLTSVSTLVSEGFLLLLVAIAFVMVDPLATLFVTLYFGAIILVIQTVIGGSLKRAGQNLSIGTMKSSMSVNDVVDSFREIAVFHKQQHFIDVFRQGRNLVAQSNAMLFFLGSMPRYIVETFLMLGVVAFVGWQFASGQLASGFVTVGVFVTGGVRIMASLLPLQNAVANIKTQSEQSQLAYNLLEQVKVNEHSILENSSNDANERLQVPKPNSLDVVIDGVTFFYPESDIPALKNVSMQVFPGQHVAIIGPSGAGKTTIVDLMLGLISPSQGTVSMSGQNPKEIIKSSPGLISYVPQSPGIVTGTIAENIALGIKEEEIDYSKLQASIDSAFLRDFIDSLPDGVHTSVGKQADALSGGQIQRLGLARALYEEPKLIILDEATSALDAASEAFVSQSLEDLGDDVTVIVIAHRLSTVQHSDVVFVVEDGEITASGKFSELRENVPMVAEYVKLMSFDD